MEVPKKSRSTVGLVSKDKDPIIDDKQNPLKTSPTQFQFEIQDICVSKSEQKERITPTKKEILDTNIDCEKNLKMNNALDPKGENSLNCEMCSKSFSTKQSLKRHVSSVHEGKKQHCTKSINCEICSKSLSSSRSLKNHISFVHDGKKTIECNICSSKFSHKVKFKIHMASVHELPVHTEDKGSVKCELCDKKLSSKSHLKIHISSVHERKKPFECMICGSKFSQKHGLDGHIAVIHEINVSRQSARCDLCDRDFSTKNNLNQHIKSTHEKSKHFKCLICESGFGTSRDL